MRLGLRLFLGFFLVAGLSAFILLRVVLGEFKPSVREVMEDMMVDTANLVAELAAGLASRTAPASWLGVLLLEGGVACFLWQARCYYVARVRRKTDVGMHFAGTALAFLAASALLGPFVLALGVMHPRIATIYVMVGLLGGIVMFIVGFFYKIVPLLAWTVRFKDRMGKGTAPTVAQMFSSRVAHAQLALMSLAVTLLATGVATASLHVTRCGAVLFAAGVLLFISQILRVTMGGEG